MGNSDVKLACLVESKPALKMEEITWMFEGSDLPRGISVVDGAIHIRKVNPNHIGTYTCSLQNKDFNLKLAIRTSGITGRLLYYYVPILLKLD